MTDLRKAAEMALEALEEAASCVQHSYLPDSMGHDWDEQIKALRQALAEPERKWVGLTDDEIYDYADKFLYQHGSNYGIRSFGKAIEAKLKEKNT